MASNWDKSRKKKQRAGGYAGHTWAIAAGLGRVVLVVGIFAASQSRFETVVFAMLVLIYNGMDAAYRAQSHSMMLMAFGIDNQFKRVAMNLKYEELSWEREACLEQERKTEVDEARRVIRFYISSGFIGITWIYAIFKLLDAVYF